MNDFRDLGDYEFEVTRRGYDREQVDTVLAELRAELATLRSQLADAAVIPGDGTYPEPVQAELDRVSEEVESIIGAAREAAEGLRTRAAAEASHWREEADEDARRWRAEAEAESTHLRAEAATAAERMTSEARDEASKRQSDADSYAARIREEADAYSQLTKQVADSEASQVKEEADAYAHVTRQAADEESAEARESADAYATRVSGAADAYSAQTREAAETESSRLRDEAEAYATEVRSAATDEAERITSEASTTAGEARASADDYARALRQSADAESARQRADAQAAAELARSTVWEEATAILQNVAREMLDVRERGENESLAIIAEAEQQSHRLVSQARQSSEEQRRAARIEADRLVGEAQEQHDEIIEAANRAAAAAQERAQALERRREELMGQLEKAQKSMKAMEEELETRRETLRDREVPVDSSTVKVVPHPEPEELAGVRVIPSAKSAPTSVPVSAEEIMDEVRSLREQREQAGGEADETATPSEPEPVAPAVTAGNDIDALFANLRQVDEGDPAPSTGPPRPVPSVDPDQMRERLLLPLQNRAHREVKRQLTEQQNLALEQLRVTGADWNPDANKHAAAFAPAIDELIIESARAGYLAARELGIRTDEPPEISLADLDVPAGDFAVDLAAAVAGSLEVSRNAGEPNRKVSAAMSRVYRSWRTDTAEHRLRELSDVTYADALRTALRQEGYEDTEWALGDWAAARHAS